MAPNITQYQVEENMNGKTNNGENVPQTAGRTTQTRDENSHDQSSNDLPNGNEKNQISASRNNNKDPVMTDDKEQRTRRKKRKNKSKGQGQVTNGSEDDNLEITLNETMSSMGTNGDDTALDLKDPDSLSRSKARRVRRKRLKERNTNCNDGALDNEAAGDDCTGNKTELVGPVSPEPTKPAAPMNTDQAVVPVESGTAVPVSDDEDQPLEENIETTQVKDDDCTTVPPVEKLTFEHGFTESTSIQPEVAPHVDSCKEVVDEQVRSIEGAANAQIVENESASPVVADKDLTDVIKEETEEQAKPLEAEPAPKVSASQIPTTDEMLVSLEKKVLLPGLREEEEIKKPEVSSDVSVVASKGESVDQIKIEDSPPQPMSDAKSLAVTEESNDLSVAVTKGESVDQTKVPVEDTTPQPIYKDESLTTTEESSDVPLPPKKESHQCTAATDVLSPSTCDVAEVAASKARGELAYKDEEVKADKEDCGCATCNVM